MRFHCTAVVYNYHRPDVALQAHGSVLVLLPPLPEGSSMCPPIKQEGICLGNSLALGLICSYDLLAPLFKCLTDAI